MMAGGWGGAPWAAVGHVWGWNDLFLAHRVLLAGTFRLARHMRSSCFLPAPVVEPQRSVMLVCERVPLRARIADRSVPCKRVIHKRVLQFVWNAATPTSHKGYGLSARQKR
eukprot:4514768-Pleurochrysis_carterae.AAC.1